MSIRGGPPRTRVRSSKTYERTPTSYTPRAPPPERMIAVRRGSLGGRAINRSEERRVGKECRSLCDWSSDVCSSDLVEDVREDADLVHTTGATSGENDRRSARFFGGSCHQ